MVLKSGTHLSSFRIFEERFKLYAPNEYEIEALQIFTRETLAFCSTVTGRTI